MRGTKYLGELMTKYELSNNKNNLILAPIGSGKTYYIFNELRKNKKILYLCDNNNLKEQAMKEPKTYGFHNEHEFEYNFEVNKTYISTYKEFGSRIEFDIDNEYVPQFDLIVADEIHSLIEFYSYSNDAHLSHAIRFLLTIHKVPIIMFTATPYYLTKLCEENPQFRDNFQVIDLSKDRRIRRYTERRKCFINNLSQARLILDLKEYANGFNYMGMKCLIYTKRINEMQEIEELCKNIEDVDLRPICIWSINADKPMNTEQLFARQYLIENERLPEEYNVLIINKASETGINIKDENMDLAIINSTNLTEQTQARGRIRKDIDMIAVRTDLKKLPPMTINIRNKYLYKWITKDDINELIKEYNIKNKDGNYIGIRALNKILNDSGYGIDQKRVTVKGKKITKYKIVAL